jgi:hypothetical protein
MGMSGRMRKILRDIYAMFDNSPGVVIVVLIMVIFVAMLFWPRISGKKDTTNKIFIDRGHMQQTVEDRQP